MKADLVEDISFFLYLIPVTVYLVYTVYNLTILNITYVDNYLSVARNPIWFVLSLLAISISFIFQIQSVNKDERQKILSIHSKRMRMIGIVIIVLSLAEAILVSDVQTNPAGLFLTARFPILFTSIMFLQSAFIQIPFSLQTKEKFTRNLLSSILIIAGPITYYIGDMLNLPFLISLSIALMLVIFGIILFSRN